MLSSVMSKFGNGIINSIAEREEEIVSESSTMTKFQWKVGKLSSLGMGNSISAEFKTGKKEYQQSWRISFYPQGFSDPESTSFFVTNVGCLEGHESKSVSTTVEISILKQNEEKGSMKRAKNMSNAGLVQTGACRPYDNQSMSSASSTLSRSSQMSVSSKGRSVRSGSMQVSQMQAQLGLSRRFCKSFSQANHTYGFESFVDREYLFNLKNGFLVETSKDQIKPMDGTIIIQVTLFCIIGITLNSPERASEINNNGWQRVEWTISDFSLLCKSFRKDTKLSSPEFSSNGMWMIDLYPHGYRIGNEKDQWISIYLHAVRDYLDKVVKRKCRFRIGLKKQNPMPQALYAILGETEDEDVYFPKSKMITNIFTCSSITAGYQYFIPLNTLVKGRDLNAVLSTGKSKSVSPQLLKGLERELVAGKFDKGGSITIVVDILMIDSMEGQVQQMLRYMRPKKKSRRQAAKISQIQDLEIFKCFAQQTPCYFCGECFAPSDLISSPSSRLPQFGYEIGREHVIDTILSEEDPSLAASLVRLDLKVSLQKVMTNLDLLPKFSVVPCLRKRNASENQLAIEPEELSASSPSHRAQTKEMERKVEFEKKLESLRKNVEDSLYSKPVCFKCIELCNELETFPTLLASNIFEELDNQTSYANLKLMEDKPLWKQMKEKVDLLLAGVGLDPKNKITIARGGTYGEPLELARYCGGKIPASEDETQSEIFCDVRFDRSRKQVKGIERVFFKESRKYRCMGTGKVFCETCIKFRAAVPEFSEKPECAEVFPVCLEEWRRRSVEGNSKILSVTEQKPTGGGVWNIFPQSGRRVGILMQQANEEEEDEESPLIEAVRSIPFVGKEWAEGASKWMSEQ